MFETLFHAIHAHWARRMTLYRLQQLDDRLLDDLGTSRDKLATFIDRFDRR